MESIRSSLQGKSENIALNKNCSNSESKDILFGISVLRIREKRQLNSEIQHTTIIKHNY